VAIRQESPSVLDANGSGISVVMADVVAKAMKKRPAERFESAARMRSALQHVQVIRCTMWSGLWLLNVSLCLELTAWIPG
jgi:hypothetical protein